MLHARRDKAGGTFIDHWTDESWFASVGVRGQRSLEVFGADHEVYAGVRLHREWLPDWQIDSTPVAGGGTTRIQDASFHLNSVALHVDDTFEPPGGPDRHRGGAGWNGCPRPRVGTRSSASPTRTSSSPCCPRPVWPGNSPRTGAAFANWGEGFRAPQFWGYAFAAEPQDALEFERGSSAELGLRHVVGGGVELQTAIWQVDFDDYLVFDSGFYENIGAIRSRGVDFTGQWDASQVVPVLSGVSLYATLTLQDSELRSGPHAGNQTPYAWDLQAAWRAHWEPGGGWLLSLGGVHVGESYSDAANTVADSADGSVGLNEGWTIWDARVGREFWLGDHALLELAGGVTNLFDRDWEVHSRGGFFGPGLVAGMPRQTYVTLLLDLRW